MPMKLQQQESAVEQQQWGEEKLPENLLYFEQILHDDPLMYPSFFSHPFSISIQVPNQSLLISSHKNAFHSQR